MELLDVGAEGLRFGEDNRHSAGCRFGESLDVDGNLPSMLGMIVRSSPAPVIARICDWSSITDSTSTGDFDSSSMPGAARIAVPVNRLRARRGQHHAAHAAASRPTVSGMIATPVSVRSRACVGHAPCRILLAE